MGVSCNLCGQDSASVLFVKKGFILGRCAYCELVYVQNPPEAEELRILYSFQAGYHECFRDDEAVCEKQIALAVEHYDLMKTFKAGGRLLDIGCSAGFFLKVARDLGWETYGLELSSDTATLARERYGLEVAVGELQESTFQSNYFDVVTLWDVIEHLADPKKTLSIVQRILKDDGILVISTPNIDGVFPRLSYKIAHLINYWPHPEPPRHLFQFSKKTLGHLLQITGFELLEARDDRIPIDYSFGNVKEVLRSLKKLSYSLVFIPIALAGPLIKAGDNLIVAATKAGAR